jgi:hypothetical protein
MIFPSAIAIVASPTSRNSDIVIRYSDGALLLACLHSMMIKDAGFLSLSAVAMTMHSPISIKGVVIRPDGDVHLNHLCRYSDKYLLPTDPIFSSDFLPTQTSVLLEIPLLVERLNDRSLVPGDAYHKNGPATSLHLRPCSAFVPFEWQRKVGAVLVVRMDRKPLSCLHLEAICKYHCMLLGDVNSIGWSKGVSPKLTKKAFEVFWYDYKRRQLEAGRDEFEDLDSPYGI